MKRSLRLTNLLVTGCFLLSTGLAAQVAWHKAAGPDSLAVNTFFIHDGVIFAGTADSGIYRSENNGISWVASNEGILDSSVLRTANNFAASGDTLYSAFGHALGGHIYASPDNGNSWTPTSFSTGATDIAAAGPVICASTGSGFFLFCRSEDHGANWQVNQYPFYHYYHHYQNVNDTLYAISVSLGLMISADRGANWQSVGFAGVVCLDYFIQPGITGIATMNGIFLSPDRGGTWQPANTSGLGADATRIRHFTGAGDTLVAASDTAVYYALISGMAVSDWSRIPGTGLPQLSEMFHINDILAAGGYLLLGTFDETAVGTGTKVKGIGIWYLPLGPVSAGEKRIAGRPVRLFPNPASGRIRIVTALEEFSWRVMTADGREISVPGGRGSIDVTGLPDGLYILLLQSGNGTVHAEPFVKTVGE